MAKKKAMKFEGSRADKKADAQGQRKMDKARKHSKRGR